MQQGGVERSTRKQLRELHHGWMNLFGAERLAVKKVGKVGRRWILKEIWNSSYSSVVFKLYSVEL